VDVASLAAFRCAFGLILVFEVVRYFDRGWVHEFYVAPDFAFTYPGFRWVEAWPEPGMTLHFALLGVAGLALAAGLACRVSAALCGLLLAYVFLLDQARYLNHFYLMVLLCFLLAVTDAGRVFSLGRRPRAATAPRWQLALLRAQIAIVYVYAGLSKVNPDWLAGEPMRTWLGRRTDFPVVGPWFGDELAAWVFSYGGLAFDLLVVPALLWRRTRAAAVVASIGFHCTNAWLFSIGVFPWMMLAATTLFLAPDWPRRVPGAGRLLGGEPVPEARAGSSARGASNAVLAGLGLYLALQVAIPLRHLAYPGWVHWTEEGHLFSWRMMLREKDAAGVLVVANDAGEPIGVVRPRDQLPGWQAKPMLFRPELLRQFAQHVAARMREQERREVRVYSRVTVSLNGRERQYLVDPDVDLATEPWRLGPAPWIRPLVESGEDP